MKFRRVFAWNGAKRRDGSRQGCSRVWRVDGGWGGRGRPEEWGQRGSIAATQISRWKEKLCQAKAGCRGKRIVLSAQSRSVPGPSGTIALLHQGDLLHFVPLGASCTASFLRCGKEGWTKRIVIGQRRNALWRQSKSSLKVLGGCKISRAGQGEAPRRWPWLDSEVSPRSRPSLPRLLPRTKANSYSLSVTEAVLGWRFPSSLSQGWLRRGAETLWRAWQIAFSAIQAHFSVRPSPSEQGGQPIYFFTKWHCVVPLASGDTACY